MTERLVCLDTSILIKNLATDEKTPAAASLVEGAVRDGAWLIAPAFAWAEVGSVLRKKLRQGLLLPDEAAALWTAFLDLPIEYVDTRPLQERTWQIGEQYGLPTLYDAAFLACTEVALAPTDAEREFWTADHELLRQLGAQPPVYVRQLGAHGPAGSS